MIGKLLAAFSFWLVAGFSGVGSAADAPGLSRMLDAVLLPLDAPVARELDLSAGGHGLVLVAMDPRGTAAQLNLQPGDVLVNLEGRPLRQPVDVDLVTGYWLGQGKGQLDLRILRGAERLRLPVGVGVEDFGNAVDLENVSRWPSVSSSGFSYQRFYSAYGSAMTSLYAEESQMIEEASIPEAFGQEMQAAENLVNSGNEDALYSDDGSADDGGGEELPE